MCANIPRLMIAGLSGDSGKTIASLSLLTAFRRKGLAISVFKKGPDYIDAAWLARIAGVICRNLDTFMVAPDLVLDRFACSAQATDIALIEGNRGLYDGRDAEGTHSSASLARLIDTPVVLVVDATKSTRTLAALIKGCIDFEPETKIAGVIINRIAGERHRRVVTDAIEIYCSLPVLGCIPKLDDKAGVIPGRHLGLITPAEFDDRALEDRLAAIADQYLDVDRILGIARSAEPIKVVSPVRLPMKPTSSVRLGYFCDSVFTFYYPENLEALERHGAQLVPLSSLTDGSLPDDLDGLYIGGGFPETQVERLVSNESLRISVKTAAEAGMPIYAECGGLIYLCRTLSDGDYRYPMAGVFDVDLAMNRRPVGHGYAILKIDQANPFFEIGQEIRGHEFHYSGPADACRSATCMKVMTGVGLGYSRDGLVYRRTLASYVHTHADGVRGWATRFVAAAGEYRSERSDPDEGEAAAESGQTEPIAARPALV
ncbi:MAG: cobyrinate a,c-diamide synthase [bacterium]